MNEQWMNVIGFEDYYEVSNYGNIRSKDRVIFDKNFSKSGKPFERKRIFLGKMLKPSKVCGLGHLAVAFYQNGRSEGSRLIHRVVAEHFIPNPEKYPIVDHIDGNPENNRVDNLRWTNYFVNNANTPYVRYLHQLLDINHVKYKTQEEYYGNNGTTGK